MQRIIIKHIVYLKLMRDILCPQYTYTHIHTHMCVYICICTHTHSGNYEAMDEFINHLPSHMCIKSLLLRTKMLMFC